MRIVSVFVASLSILGASLASSALAADSWGSVAYSPSSKSFGTSHDFSDEGEAASRALEACMEQRGGEDCITAVTFANACGAVMAGPDGWGHAYDTTEEAAQSRALSACSANSRGCDLVVSHCSPDQSIIAD
jgi:serine/threonine-protein kinase